jgi:hypothetical protein
MAAIPGIRTLFHWAVIVVAFLGLISFVVFVVELVFLGHVAHGHKSDMQ